MSYDRNVDAAEKGIAQNGGDVRDSSKLRAGGSYVLEIKDLSYEVKVKNGKDKDITSKIIVHPLSFKIKPKEMMAIMGASGAGKSTLLDILATRIPQSKVDGQYLLNDEPISSTFKRISGYVMQDDALYPLLTVRETLQYAALLRIPGLPRHQKMEIAEETITALKLNACANTIIGDERHRGVSGGEKRRVSIGVDIVHQPSIIFLDEPTSGLDSTTALQIVETLNTLCLRDRTIALTIHQPSSRVFETFTTVMFMSKGHLVYNGSPNALSTHISKISKNQLPQFANLSELFLEVIDEHEREGTVETLVEHRKEVERNRQPSEGGIIGRENEQVHTTFANGLLLETSILLQRNSVNVLRTPELFFIKVTLCMVVALVMGSLFWNLNLTNPADVVQLGGYIAFLEAFFLFTSLEVLPIFLNERNVFVREHSRGAYRLSSFVMANSLIIMPFLFICAVVFILISFFMLGLEPGGGNLIYHIIATFTVLTAGNAFATLVSGFVPDALTGNSAGTALFAFMFLFGGFFIKASAIPDGWIWFNYISVFRYPFEGLIKSNLDTLKDGEYKEEMLKEFNVDGWDRWASVGILLVFTVGFRFLFYLVLKLKYSPKQ